MLSMLAPSANWPTWVRIALLAPVVCFLDMIMGGFWPKDTRQWRNFGIGIAGFAVFCVVMICVFHYGRV